MEDGLVYNTIRTPDGTVLVSYSRHDYKTYTDESSRFKCDFSDDDRMPYVIVDGQEISWTAFGRMIKSGKYYHGAHGVSVVMNR